MREERTRNIKRSYIKKKEEKEQIVSRNEGDEEGRGRDIGYIDEGGNK